MTAEKMAREEPKTMTAKDTWIAMAEGKCVKAGASVHRINVDFVQFWNGEKWCASIELGSGPYSIVPDPSKPVDEYEQDKEGLRYALSDAVTSLNYKADVLVAFFEKWLQRKEQI